MTEQTDIQEKTEEIKNKFQIFFGKGDYSAAIQYAEKILEKREYDVELQLFIANALYNSAITLETEKNQISKQMFRQAFYHYDAVYRGNPHLFISSGYFQKKLECSRKRW